VQCFFWFYQDDLRAFSRHGSVLHALWHDIEFTRIQGYDFVAQVDVQVATDDEEKFVFILV